MRSRNDLIFRELPDGRLELVGQFEALYQTETDPWSQSGFSNPEMQDYYFASRSRLAASIMHYSHMRRWKAGIEFGCGLGYSTTFLQDATHIPMTGVDISETAILKARQRASRCKFLVSDLLNPEIKGTAGHDFGVMNQMLWYVLHDLDRAVANCLTYIKPGGVFMISQSFLKEQKYGKEIADGFHGLLRLFLSPLFLSRLMLIEASYDPSEAHPLYDGLLVFRLK